MSVLLLSASVVAYAIVSIVLAIYISYLRKRPYLPGDSAYYSAELSFDSAMVRLEHIEKFKGREFNKQRAFILSCKQNAMESGREYSHYQDLIEPVLGYTTLSENNVFRSAWSLCDTFLKAVIVIPILLYTGGTYFVASYLFHGPSHPAHIYLFGLYIIGGFVLLRFGLAKISAVLRQNIKKFRERQWPLGAISKAVIALEGLFAGITGSHRLSILDESRPTGATSIGGLGGFSGGLGGGGGFSGFGGGSFGGGGSGGSW